MSNSPPKTPSFPPFVPTSYSQSIGATMKIASTSTKTPPKTPIQTLIMAGQQPARPWANPGLVQMPTPHHALPKHP